MRLTRSIPVQPLALLAACALLLGTVNKAGAQAGVTSGTGPAPVRSITVTGEGRVNVRPDVARTQVGVTVTAPRVKDAIALARTQMVSVLSALKRTGVAERDILTTSYTINHEAPVPRAEGAAPRTRVDSKGRYHVANMVQVTVRDIERVDAVLDAVTAAGVNQVWGVSFAVDNPDSAATKARELAVAQARAKAEELARASGVRLGPVLSVGEDAGARPYGYAAKAMMAEGGSGGPISAGELTFTAQVQVVYAIE
jgi:uncharacterized protein YggE